jgi:hypothetical protein
MVQPDGVGDDFLREAKTLVGHGGSCLIHAPSIAYSGGLRRLSSSCQRLQPAPKARKSHDYFAHAAPWGNANCCSDSGFMVML